MGLILGIILLAALLFAVGSLIGFTMNVLGFMLLGLVIGAVARLIIPGRQAIGILATAIYGAAGALIGMLLGDRVFDLGGTAQLALSVVAAVILVAMFAGTDRGRETRRVTH